MDQLRIKDLEVYAYHGVFPAEKELGQRFVLDLWVDYEMTRAARTGDLEASIHYGILAEQLTEWMQAEKIDLIETVAFQLVQKIFESCPPNAADTADCSPPSAAKPRKFPRSGLRFHRGKYRLRPLP